MWKWWYQTLAQYGLNLNWTFMNYGYASLNGEQVPELEEGDEKSQFFIQLYHFTVYHLALQNKRVLEIGSGWGGGGSFVARYHQSEEYIGVDFSQKAVQLANKLHGHIPNLKFVCGDAENLPFDDNTFDAVINVESSHCYGDMVAFLQEVKRVLKSGGKFSWTDFRIKSNLAYLNNSFEQSGLKLVREETITENVIKALDEIHDKKMTVIDDYVPRFLKSSFMQFAGVKHSKVYDAFVNGDTVYLGKVFEKP
jgi:ubiquinone/menaquinone biosynthesis C-methylase UbiE